MTLTVTVSPDDAADKSVTWSSDKLSVATVDQNGLVTAVAIGTAITTATAGTQWGTKCTTAQWTALAAKGCVFLPFTGWRSNVTISQVDNPGYYWSSSLYSATGAYRVCFTPTILQTKNEHYSNRSSGLSVRLVRDVEID